VRSNYFRMVPSRVLEATSLVVAPSQSQCVAKTSEDVDLCLLKTSQPFLEPDRMSLTGFKPNARGFDRLRADVILSPIQLVRAEPAVTALVY
jgi:hypothetical protein